MSNFDLRIKVKNHGRTNSKNMVGSNVKTSTDTTTSKQQ
jgi:hypothetical protein